MTAWTDLVTKVYNENKSKPGYKLKNAMKDAAKIYKRSPTATASDAAPGKTKKGRKGSRRQTKKRRSRK
jgi:hypothetical protein